MLGFYIAIFAFLVLALVYLRKYLLIEKGISLKAAMSGRKKFFHHKDVPADFEITIDEMIPSVDKVDSKNIAKGDLLLKKAEIQFNRGDFKSAEQALIQVLALNPAEVKAYNSLGMLYLHQGKFNKAENIFRKLILTVASEPAFFSNLGLALYRQGNLEEAKTHYKKAIEMDSSRAGRYFSLAQIFKELGEAEEALTHMRQAVEMEPKNEDYLITLAEFYIENGLKREAKSLLEEVIALDPKNEMAGKMIGEMEG
jgi:Flp pilus assembly protein TadD